MMKNPRKKKMMMILKMDIFFYVLIYGYDWLILGRADMLFFCG